MSRHSKWPRALRLHGSVAPKLVLPLLGTSIWATAITLISEKVRSSMGFLLESTTGILILAVNVHPIVITVLGLLVGLALNLRSQTAYERYMEGRKMWAHLGASSTSLARHIWLHVKEGEGTQAKEILLGKTTALNLVCSSHAASTWLPIPSKALIAIQAHPAHPAVPNIHPILLSLREKASCTDAAHRSLVLSLPSNTGCVSSRMLDTMT